MGVITRFTRALKHLSTPLLPDDYTHLLNPLWSSRELRGQIEAVARTSPTTAELVIRPGWGMPTDFKAGQFIGIGVEVAGTYKWRSYSLTNPPLPADGLLTISVRALKAGYVSQHLVAFAKPGTVVRLAAPAGDFYLPEPLPPRIAFVTAGTGVTPVISMLRYLAASGAEVEVEHIHSYRGEDEAVFVDELRELAAATGTTGTASATGATGANGTATGRFTYHLHTRNTATETRLDPEQVTAIVGDFGSLASSGSAYACGPVELLKSLEEAFPGLRSERFTVDRGAASDVGGTASFGSRGEVDVDGATTILEAAERIGVNLPYGCRMGICATCTQQLADGQARDIRTGQTYEAGERVRVCVCAPAGRAEIDL